MAGRAWLLRTGLCRSLAEADQREVAERRHRTSLDQAHVIGRGLGPAGKPPPGKLRPPAEPIGDRLEQMLQHPPRPSVRAHAVEDDDLAARLEHARELVEG